MGKKIHLTESQFRKLINVLAEEHIPQSNDLAGYYFVSTLSLNEVEADVDVNNLSNEQFINLLLTKGNKNGERQQYYDGVQFSEDGRYAFGFHESVMGEEMCDLLKKEQL